MDLKQEETSNFLDNQFKQLLTSLSKCKIDFIKEREEAHKIRESNSKLEAELRESRELEKSHRFHLQTSREMIGNLQETVSQLVYLKRDVKKLKDEIALKDSSIAAIEKDTNNIIMRHNESVSALRNAHMKQIEELNAMNEKKIQQAQHDSDTQIAQFTCAIAELRSKIKDMETEHRDKMNVVVLEYEEKMQRGASQVTQLQEQLARQAAHTDANIDAYRRRLEELEEKLKQSQFKQYLASTPYTSYESQVERPYSVDRDPYESTGDFNTSHEVPKPKYAPPSQNKAPRPSNTLQVLYYGNKTPTVQKNAEKKGQFAISKKRKLYSDKDLQDF